MQILVVLVGYAILLSVLLLPTIVYAWVRPPWRLAVGAGAVGFTLGAVMLGAATRPSHEFALLLGAVKGGLLGEGTALICVAVARRLKQSVGRPGR